MNTTQETVWAVEVDGKVVEGGLDHDVAIQAARDAMKEYPGTRVRIAEYTMDEGSSAIAWEEVE